MIFASQGHRSHNVRQRKLMYAIHEKDSSDWYKRLHNLPTNKNKNRKEEQTWKRS